jgi:hypothetical protein
MPHFPKIAAAVGAVTIGLLGFQGVASAGTQKGNGYGSGGGKVSIPPANNNGGGKNNGGGGGNCGGNSGGNYNGNNNGDTNNGGGWGCGYPGTTTTTYRQKPPPKPPPPPPHYPYPHNPFPIVFYRYPTCVPYQVTSYPGSGKGSQSGKSGTGSGYKLVSVDHNESHGHK